MVLLTAIQISLDGRYEFRIEAPDHSPAVTQDLVKAARILFRHGVRSPLTFIQHTQEWGAVEIVEERAGEPPGV
jgi:hypothetical protein